MRLWFNRDVGGRAAFRIFASAAVLIVVGWTTASAQNDHWHSRTVAVARSTSTIVDDVLVWKNTSTNWNSASSWTNTTHVGQDRVPTFTDVATFNEPALNNPQLTLVETELTLGLHFDTLGTGYTISGISELATLRVGASGIVADNATGTNTITASLLLNADQAITQASGGTLNITGRVLLGGGTGTTTITFGSATPSQNGTLNFSPSSATIANNLNLVTNVSVTLPGLSPSDEVTAPAASLMKNGAGTLTMTGASTYNGTTTVNAGTLLATNSSGSATGTGAVAVNNGGTLGGTGTIAGATTINGGGRITGGNVGTVGALTLQSGVTFSGASGNLATYVVDLAGNTSDRLNITGVLDLNGAYDRLSFSGATDGTSSYVLATYSSVNGTFDSISSLPNGYELQYNTSELDLVPIPEPSTWVAAGLSLFAIIYSQRKRIGGVTSRC